MTCTSMSISALTSSPATSPLSDHGYFHEASSVSSHSSTSTNACTSTIIDSSSSSSSSSSISWCGELPIYSEVSPQPPLTLQERRTRNKAASAKYRQKKSQQQKEMKRLVCHITEQNAILDRQLQELRAENDRLRKTTDQMRGQLVARKMFRQWLLKEAEAHPSSAHSNRSAFHPAWGAGHHLVQDEVDLLYPDDSDELF